MALLACLWVAGLSWGGGGLSSFALGALLVIATSVVWGLWCAPRATRRLRRRPRWALKFALVTAMVVIVTPSGASPTWVTVGLVTWALLVGTLRWDSHEISNA